MSAIAEIEKRAVGFLQETDGSKSMTRLCVGAIVFFALGIIAGLFFKLRAPITVGDFCNAVGALATFSASVCGALYGINRVSECFENRATRGPQQ